MINSQVSTALHILFCPYSCGYTQALRYVNLHRDELTSLCNHDFLTLHLARQYGGRSHFMSPHNLFFLVSKMKVCYETTPYLTVNLLFPVNREL